MNKSNENQISEKENALENNELTKETLKEICKILTSTSEEFAFDFLECLFTPTELKDMANRWLLVKELEKGTTQREIAKKFGMSLCKITRGSKELHKENSAFRAMLNMLEQQNKNN